jgi:tRNA threonylcarbamoyladenosine biosynthesis protein TsaE
MQQHTLAAESQMLAFAQNLAATARIGDVFLLNGPMGAGKSVFARGFIRALTTPDMEVPSPTFTLVQTYETKLGEIWHFDLYRIKSPEDVMELGWEEALANTIMLIEWPQRLGHLIPAKATHILFELGKSENERIVSIHAP